MYRNCKSIFCILLLFLVRATDSEAQHFSIQADTVQLYTQGTIDSLEAVELKNFVRNTDDTAFHFEWRMVSLQPLPSGWSYFGFCDNMLCYTTGWQSGASIESGLLAVSDSSLFKLMLRVPQATAANATALVAFEVKTAVQTDTAYFKITKSESTGVDDLWEYNSTLKMYPNPAKDVLYISCENVAAVKCIKVFDYTGQLFQLPFDTIDGIIHLSLNELVAAPYTVWLTDAEGKRLASGIFIKNP